LAEKEWTLSIVSLCLIWEFIDKNNFHINGCNVSSNVVCEECESENFGFKVKFSDHRKIENADYFILINITLEVKMGRIL
jgi:hypothetical protein